MIKRKLQIFVSSTYNDLLSERQAAVEAILRYGHIPAGMELFAAGDKSQWDTIRAWINESDIYMLILGGRYGSVDPETNKSYTQLEYEYACSTGKPLFALVLSDDALDRKVKKKGRSVLESERQQELKGFRSLVTSKICRMVHDDKDIKLAIQEAIQNCVDQHSLNGWVSGKHLSVIPPRFVEHAQMWVGRDIEDDFILKDENLSIFLKDGRTFFTEKRLLLERRFSEISRKTNVLLLHPQYEHMTAVAAMDPHKKENPEKQRSDCLFAIETMHGIRDSMARVGKNIESSVGFWGYHLVPTWNGFLARSSAVIHLYFTRPHRGELNTLLLRTQDDTTKPHPLFQAYRTEFDEILRELGPDSNLWRFVPP